MAKRGIKSRLGKCYELAGGHMLADFGGKSGDKLVHGSIQGGDNPRIGHAWIEHPDGDVFDPVADWEGPAEVYAFLFHAIPDHVYDYKAACEAMVGTENYGPWEPSSGLYNDLTGAVIDPEEDS